MKKPRYTVIIPALNEQEYLPRLLESLIRQTEKSFHVILVDGGSTDKTVSRARRFQSRLDMDIVVSDRAGLPYQRNAGAKGAVSPWLVFIDADSELLPYFFERLTVHIQEKKPEFVTTWFTPDSETVGDALVTLLMNMVHEASLKVNKPVSPGPLTCVKRKIFVRVGGYDASREWGEDYDFSMKMKKAGVTLCILREALYRVSLRRFRTERKAKLLRMYARIVASIFFTGNAPRRVPGYIMGGDFYAKEKKDVKIRSLMDFEKKVKTLVSEFFD